LLLNVSGKEYPLSFTAPAFSLKVWIKENVVKAVLIGIAILLIILLAIFFIYRLIKKRQKDMLQLTSKQDEIQEEATANRQALDDYRKQIDNKELIAQEKEQEQRFLKMMQTKNLFPRLQYTDNGKNTTYTINKPETSIGRDEDNDIILLSDSVSRHHAKIIFNGASFEIQDLGSTNKVIVNGAFVKQSILKKGDIIGLGEIVVYFYN
jgi:pSer/pThr/pTyr-binding forkhead associated (FHA) protein